MHYVDSIIICSYLLASLAIGFLKSKGYANLQRIVFYKDITFPVLIATIFASAVEESSSVAIEEKIYLLGIVYMLRQVFQPIYWLIIAYVIAPKIEKFEGCLTISDIMGRLYGKSAEAITSVSSLIMYFGFLSIQALALGKIFNYFFHIQDIYGIFIGYFAVVIYSTFGRPRAVIYNHIFEISIVFFVLPIACITIGLRVGGINEIINHLYSSHLNFEFGRSNILLITSMVFYSLLPSFDAEIIQRYLMTTNSKRLKKSLLWSSICAVVLSLFILGIFYVMNANDYDLKPSLVLPYFIDNLLPVGLKGMMVTGIIALMISKSEARLNAGGVILYRNYLERLLPEYSEKTQLSILKFIIYCLALCFIILVSVVPIDILDLLILIRNFWDPIICVPVLAGILGIRTNNITFVASTISALICVFIGRLYSGEFATVSFMFGVIGCAIGFLAVHYFQTMKGAFPKQLISSVSQRNFFTQIGILISSLREDYRRHSEEEPRYNTFLYFVGIFLVLYGGHIFWFGCDKKALVIIWGLIHGMCILLMLRRCIFVTPWLQAILPHYFKVALIIGLPTLSSYVLLTHKGSDFWVLTGVLSATCIVHIVDALRAIIYYTIGIILALIIVLVSEEIATHWIAFKYIPIVYSYFFFVSYAVVRNRECELEERIENIHFFAGAIAHEVKSPLATVNMCAQNINMLIKSAFSGKEAVFEADQAEMIRSMSSAIVKVSDKGATMVESLLLSMKKEIVVAEKEMRYISSLISSVVEEYTAIYGREEKISTIVINDFKLMCSPIYFKQLFFNLFNNAFKYAGSKAEIKITVMLGSIVFEDNGKGISKDKLPNIFKRFYTTSESGTGLGLPFCKMVVEDMGGEIRCESKEEKYTKFIMDFKSIQST